MSFEDGLDRARSLAIIAQILSWSVAASSLLSALGVAVFINGNWPDSLAGTYDFHGLDMLILADVAILILSFFAVGAWIYRAHANLLLIDAPATEYSPGWAVGWFAIPIANLFKPFQAMKALWQASHSQAVDSSETAPGLLWAWWITWLVSSISGFADEFNAIDVAAYISTAISAVCLIAIIRTITAAQPSMSISSTFE